MRNAYCRASGAFSIAILLALGMMAQANAQSLRDFAEIAASPVVVTPDPSGRSAVLQVDTSVDVACSVVYGEDDSFGSISVDNDMDGGAHSEHQPVLGGLEPDTTYQYRLQGTAPDGTIYVSEVMTFSTPPEPVGGPLNLALDAVVTGASSEFSTAFAAANAFDGDGTTEWSSRGDGDDAWIEIDLGGTEPISEIVYRTRSMSDGTATTETFTLTADGELVGEFPADESVRVDIEAQVLRFDVETSSGGNTGAVEILVLAADAGPT
jgi:hypothetical protein